MISSLCGSNKRDFRLQYSFNLFLGFKYNRWAFMRVAVGMFIVY